MIFYDQVVETLLRVSLTNGLNHAHKVCVVRDVAGRLHLVLDPGDIAPSVIEALEAELVAVLGGYFRAPIFSTAGAVEHARLARELLGQSVAWSSAWPCAAQDPITGAKTAINLAVWSSLERVLSKQSWVASAPDKKPWNLDPRHAPIISFYSFKGGVGRTTLLALAAARLAQDSKVVVVDLDLEAPGLGRLLGATTSRGVLDYLIHHAITGESDLTDCVTTASALPDSLGNQLQVLPAGVMDWGYLEKLSRLDYVASARTSGTRMSPVSSALTALLRQVKKQLNPDYIFVDSRAGLHDLGGLSLHGLGHVDVLVSRADQQGYDGMSLTLQSLCRRTTPDEFNPMIVHSMAPRGTGSTAKNVRADFLTNIYNVFDRYHYSRTEDDTPSEEDTAAPHAPTHFSDSDSLRGLSSLRGLDLAILDGTEVAAAVDRIRELSGREEPGAHDG